MILDKRFKLSESGYSGLKDFQDEINSADPLIPVEKILKKREAIL